MTSEGSMADDFAGFEASMRGKLSELRLPSEDDSNSPTKIINSSFTETDLGNKNLNSNLEISEKESMSKQQTSKTDKLETANRESDSESSAAGSAPITLQADSVHKAGSQEFIEAEPQKNEDSVAQSVELDKDSGHQKNKNDVREVNSVSIKEAVNSEIPLAVKNIDNELRNDVEDTGENNKSGEDNVGNQGDTEEPVSEGKEKDQVENVTEQTKEVTSSLKSVNEKVKEAANVCGQTVVQKKTPVPANMEENQNSEKVGLSDKVTENRKCVSDSNDHMGTGEDREKDNASDIPENQNSETFQISGTEVLGKVGKCFEDGDQTKKKTDNDENVESKTESAENQISFEMAVNSDTENIDSGTENLLITNVVSLSGLVAEENETVKGSNVVDKSLLGSTILDKQTAPVIADSDMVGKGVKRIETTTPVSNPDNTQDSTDSNPSHTVESKKTAGFKRSRRKRKKPTLLRKMDESMMEKSLEDMFVPIGCYLKDTRTNEEIARSSNVTSGAGSGTSVIVSMNAGSNVTPVLLKSEVPCTRDYNASAALKGLVQTVIPRQTSVVSATSFNRGVSVTPKVTSMLTFGGNRFNLSKQSTMQGPGFEKIVRYAVQPATLTASTVQATKAANSSLLNGSTAIGPKTLSANVVKKVNRKGQEDTDMKKALEKYSTINIHSVGVNWITDLIARKNPIPTYKAEPVPIALQNAENTKVYQCYECGDSFHLENSYNIHIGRRSMKISYKCDTCLKILNFTNKCQFLNHLRSHMNIDKTQAVPIHIKSESIEIKSYFDEIGNSQDFEWYKVNVNTSYCPVCKTFKYTTAEELHKHFSGLKKNELLCDKCKCQLHSQCALTAHMQIHKLTDLFKEGKLKMEEGFNCIDSMVCPECGKTFEECIDVSSDMVKKISAFLEHVLLSCLHLSFIRSQCLHCTNCNKVFEDPEKMAVHLRESLEYYYKCEKCPMALRSPKILKTHFNQKHKHTGEIMAKIIYRCHVCSTVIDDKQFLLKHFNSHLGHLPRVCVTQAHCLTCGLIETSVEKLRTHALHHHRYQQPNGKEFYMSKCVFCPKDMATPLRLVQHLFECHLNKKEETYVMEAAYSCYYCGLLCANAKHMAQHECLKILQEHLVCGDIISGDRQCRFCRITFTSTHHRTVHMKSHENDTFACETCNKKNFKDYNQFKSHSIVCSAMKKAQGKKQQVDGHILEKGDSNEAELSVCASKTNKRKQSVSDDCSDSEIKLTPKADKKKLKKTSAHESTFNCDKCSAKFSRKSKLEAHVDAEHGLHPCHLCGIMHNSITVLKRHLMIDHEGKRLSYFCHICRKRKIEKSFTIKSKLVKHLRLKHRIKNVDESEFVAELPGFPGLSEKELTPEEQTRASPDSAAEPLAKKLKTEGESTYKCAKCLFTCELKSEFTSHIVEHRTPNTFQCLECGLCYTALPSLQKHLFMVHKVRNFQSYMKENNIENPADNIDSDDNIEREPIHVAQPDDFSSEEEPQNPLECKVCYKEFDSEKLLKGHMRVHGMAFIKKSRRRSQGILPNKVTKSEQVEGRQCEMVSNTGSSIVMKIVKTKAVEESELLPVEHETDSSTMEVDSETKETLSETDNKLVDGNGQKTTEVG